MKSTDPEGISFITSTQSPRVTPFSIGPRGVVMAHAPARCAPGSNSFSSRRFSWRTSQTNRPAGRLPDYSISFQNPDRQGEVLGANPGLPGGPDVLRTDLHPRKGHEENILEV